MLTHFFFVVLAIFTNPAIASETDAFNFRYTHIPDTLEVLDAEVNLRLQAAVLKSNQRSLLRNRRLHRHARRADRRGPISCSDRFLRKALKSELRRRLYGRFEGWLNNAAEVEKRRVPISQSVYQGLRFREMWPAHLGKMGFGSVLRVNGHLIGSDKFGHFFDEGYHYFSDVHFSHTTLREAMQYGVDTEEGFFGLRTTGVKSFADMVANFNGYTFWNRVFDLSDERGYLTCNDGNFEVKRRFSFTEYLDAGWDEGVNCSQFRSPEFEEKVMVEIRALEAATGRPHACPVTPVECVKLSERYGAYADVLLHPRCAAATAPQTTTPASLLAAPVPAASFVIPVRTSATAAAPEAIVTPAITAAPAPTSSVRATSAAPYIPLAAPFTTR